jgi:hypothetical protein
MCFRRLKCNGNRRGAPPPRQPMTTVTVAVAVPPRPSLIVYWNVIVPVKPRCGW